MYSHNVVIEAVTDNDYDSFYYKYPQMDIIGLAVTDENIAAFIAVEKVNCELPVHEYVSHVTNIEKVGDYSFSVDMRIFD